MTTARPFSDADAIVPAIRCPRTGLAPAEITIAEPERLARGGRVLDLATEHHYWNHLSVEEMSELLEVCRERGWRQAIDEVLAPRVDSYTVDYVVDARRADGIQPFLVGRPRSVLDVGAGWGAVSCALAAQGHGVLALDSNLETLEFLSLRAEQEGIGSRVRCVRIDPLEKTGLPVDDDSVDVLLLNGVLEWVGAGVDHGSPRDHQLKLLRDARRALRPDGLLYVAIESRFGLSMWMGGQDHPKTRFTSLVPRGIASLMTRRAGKGPYRTWTYSYSALKKLLEEAGFTRTQFSSAFPDYRFPHSVVPIESSSTFRNNIFRPGLTKGHARILSLASYVGLHRDAVSHYLVVARP